MPLDDELLLKEDLVTDNQFHESGRILELLRITLNEEKDDSLKAMLDADFAILFDKL